MARAPWPTWGTIASGARTSLRWAVSSRRSSAATATTMASNSPERCSRVAMLPLSSSNPTPGTRAASCTLRRADPVATTAPRPSSTAERSDARSAPTSASRGSPRVGSAARVRPSGVRAGRSLAECTAMSARPSSTARWISLENTPLPPMTDSGTSVRRSPSVLTGTISISSPGCAPRSNPATWSACQRASSDARVATRTGVGLVATASEIEQFGQRGCQAIALGGSRRILETHGRFMQQLGHDPLGQSLDRLTLRWSQRVQ